MRRRGGTWQRGAWQEDAPWQPGWGYQPAATGAPHHSKEFGLHFKCGIPQPRVSQDPLAPYLAAKGSAGPSLHLPQALAPRHRGIPPSHTWSTVGRDARKHKKKNPKHPKSLQTHGVMTGNISPVTSRAVTDACWRDTVPLWHTAQCGESLAPQCSQRGPRAPAAPWLAWGSGTPLPPPSLLHFL